MILCGGIVISVYHAVSDLRLGVSISRRERAGNAGFSGRGALREKKLKELFAPRVERSGS